MGYRRLLKQYIAHVRNVTGTDLIELASYSLALGKRDLGELRTIAAELHRDADTGAVPCSYDHIVRAMLDSGELALADLDDINSVTAGVETTRISEQEFRMIMAALAR